MADILPRELPASGAVNPNAVTIVDGGTTVNKATPIQLVDAAIPLASQAEAEAGTDNAKRLTPLRSKQAIDALSLKAPFTLGSTYNNGTTGDRLLKTALLTDQPFGGIGDGTADETSAVTAAQSSSYNLIGLPQGVFKTSLSSSALNGVFQGRGQIRDAATDKRAPWFSAVKSVPTALGSWDSIETAFNGDLSKVQVAVEHRISGAATLGQPPSGYRNNQEAAAFLAYSQNTSGWNQATNGNDGRTLGHVWFIKVDNYGQGDFAGITFAAFVTGAKAGATSWLANPAVTFFNGTATAGQDGVYLNPVELDLQLNGKDAAAVGYVVNINRTVGDTPGGLGAYTSGFRSQSTGSYAVDSAFSASGLFKVGLDFSPVTLDANKAALALKAGDRIYGNTASADGAKATSYGDSYFSYEAGISGWSFTVGGVSRFQVNGGQVTVNGVRFSATSAVTLSGVGSAASYANDAAAAAGGVPIGGVYRTGTALQVRVV